MKKPIWISHRGVRDTGFTENSLAAFKLAVSHGFTWLETDLRLTSDKHIVLCHDPNLKRILGNDLTFSDLKRSDIEKLKYPCSQGLLFLDQFMTEFPNQRWVFDIKIETAQTTLAVLRQMLNKMPEGDRIEGKITFLLWCEEDELLAKRLFPRADFFARKDQCWRAGLSVILGLSFLGGLKENKAYAVPPKLWGLSLFKRRVFNSYQQKKAKVIAYLPTCNEDAQAATEAGADLILADRLFLNH